MNLPEQLYKLQQLDVKLHGRQQELNEIENQLSDDEALVVAESKLAPQKQQLTEAEKEQKSSEWELDDLQEKVSKLNDRLYSGVTKNPKELVNLENEVKSLKSRISRKEDELLGLMSQVEEMEAKVKISNEELERLKREWQLRQENLKPRKTEIEAELRKLSEARHGLAQQIEPTALKLYEQIRLTKEQAVAKVEQGRCQGCHITLPTSQWQRAKAGDLIQCNSCNRILYLE